MWEPEMTSTALNSDKKWAFLLILRADWFVLIKVLKSQHAFRLKCKSLRGNCSHCHFDTRSTFSPCSNVSLLCHTATAVPSPLSAPRHTAKILHFSNVSRKTARLPQWGWENVYRQIPPRYITVCINWENFTSITLAYWKYWEISQWLWYYMMCR